MSADPENEYFSDGLAEEIINALAHVPGLKVIARTSAFAFKGKQEDVRRIAEVLGVANVLEGSVRKAGNRIRVTAQLIAAADGEPSLVGALRSGARGRVCDSGRDRAGDRRCAPGEAGADGGGCSPSHASPGRL